MQVSTHIYIYIYIIFIYMYITEDGAWGSLGYPGLLHGGSGALGAPRDGPWMLVVFVVVSGWILKLKTCTNRDKKDPRSVHNSSFMHLVAKRVFIEVDSLLTIPNPFLASA